LAFLKVGTLLEEDPLQASLHPLGGLGLLQEEPDVLLLLVELHVEALAVLVHCDEAVKELARLPLLPLLLGIFGLKSVL
jgi:hypothetical protein